jgi:putative transposase
MSHAKNKVWIHGVFSTKYRNPLITSNVKQVVYDEIHIQIKKTGCHLETMGGIEDHIHVLFLLNRSKTLAEVFKQIKGASSYAFNQQLIFPDLFYWQKGYGAFSVSESKVPVLIKYIQNQKEHHEKSNFDVEFRSLLLKHGLPEDDLTYE